VTDAGRFVEGKRLEVKQEKIEKKWAKPVLKVESSSVARGVEKRKAKAIKYNEPGSEIGVD